MPEDRAADLRPSPEALLAAAEQETRGRLKIFLGAAPGVGKTYEMLASGHARLKEGADVVVGVVETHGRQETEALVAGLEVIPRRRVPYKGRELDEMDLDAILARRPALVLVDELAHTNAPESRHAKRYMDVEELLAAGIDVYTTLNIQHVESLNDVVAQITRVRVRETVPDAIIDRADDIEIIDITPGDLIQRLKEGKVYVPQTARRAVENYFSPGNLTALRELALRRTAQRVDEQLLTHMRAHAISGPWAAGERVLVCLSEDPRAAALVRYAKRLADRLRAPWVALYVETGRALRLGPAERDRIADFLRLAERLGGEAVTIPGGTRIADDVLGYARSANVTHIVIGKSDRARWFEIVYGSVVHDLVRRSGNISVHVIAGEPEPGPPANRSASGAPARRLDAPPYLASLGIVALATLVGFGLQRILALQNIALVFLTAVLVSAVRFGLAPALLASVAGMLAFNFFFIPPLYTFTITDPENVVALFFFLVVAVIASNLTARVRAQALAARARAKTTEDLYLFSKKLAGAGTLDDLLWATAFQIASMLKVRVVLLLAEEGALAVKAAYPPEDVLDAADLAAAKWAFENSRVAGRGADTLPGAKRLFLPMQTGRGTVGVIGIDRDKEGPLLTPEQRRLLDALADQAALAVERVNLVADVEKARLDAETDRLRSALLTSISHDLKTPLASIMGAAGTLRDFSASIAPEARADLLSTIEEEGERLNRFIANLLDMTRLESGAVAPNAALYDVGEIVGSAMRRAQAILRHHKVEIELAADLPMLLVDPVLFEQALFNLLDNAAKYAPEGSRVRLEGWSDGDQVTLRLLDEGPGIPEGDVERVFDKFYRVRKGDQVRAGTGLGLAIARGFLEAMGGTITVSRRPERSGAVFTIRMPVPVGAPQLEALS
ncbi:sensor histidine kinase KdpD [Xanthobacter dioxanivorans]|uniref:histidine kinase n=1 Tax=Xanthobacter dioxanivorans TaxID=2528964 RepID=A0A974PT86_9HYPH|nr:sensor histidine kinase KdpD [Xanthobacter dioxanivorans]QRG09343.1 sensor histidine kinase KdpD [Xanthobacter dioxanivorans]